MARGLFNRAVEYIAESAKDIIGRLVSGGAKKSDIAKAFGIDSSTITQIEKGKKPGANLAAPLMELERRVAAGESIKEVQIDRPKRVTKSGEVAKVRKSKADKEREAEEARRKAEEERAARELAAKRAELEGAAAGGITVTVSGVLGMSKDYRSRSIPIDMDEEEALTFLMLREESEQSAFDFAFEVYGAGLSAKGDYSMTVS